MDQKTAFECKSRILVLPFIIELPLFRRLPEKSWRQNECIWRLNGDKNFSVIAWRN